MPEVYAENFDTACTLHKELLLARGEARALAVKLSGLSQSLKNYYPDTEDFGQAVLDALHDASFDYWIGNLNWEIDFFLDREDLGPYADDIPESLSDV